MIWLFLVALAVLAALTAWWLLLGADRDGLFPRNNLKELRREDGGLGPMAKRDRINSSQTETNS